jgi:hypothetical protein
MKERPILFSAPMVRALLKGKKTQTRRIVKKLHPDCREMIAHDQTGGLFVCRDAFSRCVQMLPSPYGQPGDRLWVKETFAPMGDAQSPSSVRYRADREYPQVKKWKPSVFMPRRASRILLEVVSVRAERLQDISEADAMAEGIHQSAERAVENLDYPGHSPQETYRELFESINGAGSWDANPWVWVIEFRRID